MNLSAYDTIKTIDKTKTWVDTRRWCLLSREIKYRKYYCISTRYNTNTRSTDYYIILLDEEATDRKCKRTFVDSYGRIKISLKEIWTKCGLINITENSNIILVPEENADDGDIYYLDV